MADQKISELPELKDNVALLDVLPIVDASASETKQVSAKHLIESAFEIIDDGSIPGAKIDGELPEGSINTAELADGSVTAAKLADDSSGIYGTIPASGEFRGQISLDASTKELAMWTGSQWAKGFGVTSISAQGLSPIQVSGAITVDGELELGVAIEDTTAGALFLAGPTLTGGPVQARAIIGADLPPATTADLGAVSISSGLAVDANGAVSIDNTVQQSSTVHHVVTYNSSGLVTGGRKIEGPDLPTAQTNTPGVVSPGRGLSMGADGALNITNVIVPGVGTKFECDEQGSIRQILPLVASDIPPLDGSQIQTGELNGELLADKSVTMPKLADFSTTYIQEEMPNDSAVRFIGCTWYQESTAQLRCWNGNSWMSIGQGRLSQENLRWGGTINAATGFLEGVTTVGGTAGLKIGEPLPVASDVLGGLYVLVVEEGDSIGVTPGEEYDTGDWCLCQGEASGWVRVDIIDPGAQGARELNELLDVSLGVPAEDNVLVFNASGQWENRSSLDGGTY